MVYLVENVEDPNMGALTLINNFRGYNSVGRVCALQARSHQFKSDYLHFIFFTWVVQLVDTSDLESGFFWN